MTDDATWLRPLAPLWVELTDTSRRTAWPYLLSALALALLLAAWRAWRGDGGATWRKLWPPAGAGGSAALDLSYVLINRALWPLAFAPLVLSTSLISDAVSAAIAAPGAEPLQQALAPGWLRDALVSTWVIVATDFGLYWAHRLSHETPTLWAFHEVHHSAEALTPATVYRLHPVDEVITASAASLCGGLALGLATGLVGPAGPFEWLGLQGLVLAFVLLGYNLRHSHVDLDFGPLLGALFVSPAQHQVHHSVDPAHHDRNYGFMLSLWDRLFGTFHPAAEAPLTFGLGEHRRADFDRPWKLYLGPFRRCLKGGAALTLAALLGACGGVEVVPSTPQESYLRAESSALGGDELSLATRQYLELQSLTEDANEDLERVLPRLEGLARAERERIAAFALAEASLLLAQRRSDPAAAAPLIGAAAAFAWTYLFDPLLGEEPSLYDPTTRRACEIYNRAVGRLVALTQAGGASEDGRYALPIFDSLIPAEPGLAELAWDPQSYDAFLVADDYEVRNIGTRNRLYGIGAPCLALRQACEGPAASGSERFLAKTPQAYACTVILRFEGSLLYREDPRSRLRVIIELYDPLKDDCVAVGDREVPLEADLTTPLAYTFESTAKPWRPADLLNVGALSKLQGLFLLQPYQPGKVPVIFVHGLLSTPLTWLRMMNGILGQKAIRDEVQIWFYFYPTGNPIVLNAVDLRRALRDVRRELDPEGADPALDDMVIVGHSMGGVMSRMMVQDSGDAYWSAVSQRPLESYGLPEQDARQLREAFFFERVSSITRAVFLAAPHRGSTLADGAFGSIGAWLTTLPETSVALLDDARRLVFFEGPSAEFFLDNSPSGVTSLSTRNPLNIAGAEQRIAEGVTIHSIIGNAEAGVTGGTDGIVPYWSSHLDGAASELVVESGHGVHETPEAIIELRRILAEHIRAHKAARLRSSN